MKSLGLRVGLAESTISMYENGNRQPDLETLVKLANTLGVTTDRLLGEGTPPPTDSEESIGGKEAELAQIADNIRGACFERGIAERKMLSDLGFKEGLMFELEERGGQTSLEVVVKVADYLPCPTDKLLGIKEKSPLAEARGAWMKYTVEQLELFERIAELDKDPTKAAQVRSIVEFLGSKQEP